MEVGIVSEEKLTIGEKLILDEIKKVNGHLCDIKEKLGNKYVTQSVLVQTAQALQSQINQIRPDVGN